MCIPAAHSDLQGAHAYLQAARAYLLAAHTSLQAAHTDLQPAHTSLHVARTRLQPAHASLQARQGRTWKIAAPRREAGRVARSETCAHRNLERSLAARSALTGQTVAPGARQEQRLKQDNLRCSILELRK